MAELILSMPTRFWSFATCPYLLRHMDDVPADSRKYVIVNTFMGKKATDAITRNIIAACSGANMVILPDVWGMPSSTLESSLKLARALEGSELDICYVVHANKYDYTLDSWKRGLDQWISQSENLQFNRKVIGIPNPVRGFTRGTFSRWDAAAHASELGLETILLGTGPGFFDEIGNLKRFPLLVGVVSSLPFDLGWMKTPITFRNVDIKKRRLLQYETFNTLLQMKITMLNISLMTSFIHNAVFSEWIPELMMVNIETKFTLPKLKDIFGSWFGKRFEFQVMEFGNERFVQILSVKE